MLVEAVWSAKTAPGPLRAFFQRVQRNRGAPAAAVATARKLAVMIWHVLNGVRLRAARLHRHEKLGKAALKAGAPREYAKAGPGRDYGSRRSASGKPTTCGVLSRPISPLMKSRFFSFASGLWRG